MLGRGGKREGMVERPNNPEEKVRELQRRLWTCAKRSRSRRFHALYDRIWRGDVLLEAWRRVKANGGAAGVDEVSIRDIEERGAGEYLKEIQNVLKAGRYRPSPVRRRYIPKGHGRQRPLGIPTVRDRVVQMATKLVIEPIFEADFQPCSWGFRPRRGATQAMEVIREAGNRGHNWVLDADIRDYFGSIDHGKLMVLVKERISDRRVLKLIGQWLAAGVMEDGTVRETLAGTPQGGVISPLLSNIYLGFLDRIWESKCKHLGILVRYADDFVVLCKNKSQCKEALRRVKIVMERLGLEMESRGHIAPQVIRQAEHVHGGLQLAVHLGRIENRRRNLERQIDSRHAAGLIEERHGRRSGDVAGVRRSRQVFQLRFQRVGRRQGDLADVAIQVATAHLHVGPVDGDFESVAHSLPATPVHVENHGPLGAACSAGWRLRRRQSLRYLGSSRVLALLHWRTGS